MKVFVIFWLNTDNYRGVVIGDRDMDKELAVKIWWEETYRGFKNISLNISDLFAIEEEYVIDYSTKAYTY